MDGVGKQLEKAKDSFDVAMGQLCTGKGNLINQAKEFERLGVSVQVPLPEHLTAKAALELDQPPRDITLADRKIKVISDEDLDAEFNCAIGKIKQEQAPI